MKILSAEAESWWMGLSDEIRPERGINTRQLIQGLVEKFQFINFPTSIPVEGGMKFERGVFGTINIGKIEVYSDGLNIQVPSTTDDAAAVLEECLQFFFSLGVRRPISPPITYPISRIVVDLDNSVDELLKSAGLVDAVSKRLAVPGEAHLHGIAFYVDPLALPKRIGALNPTSFRLERRAEMPYEANRYFSLAHMTTANHIETLQEIERAFTD